MWSKGHRSRFVLWRKWNKNETKTHFCFVNLRTEKKTAVKKKDVTCDLLCKQVPTLQEKPFKSSNEEFASIHMYIAAYRQKFLNQLYYSNGKITVRKK